VCLGIPMQIISVDGLLARCTAKGVERQASLLMLADDPPAEGDFVVVHLGYVMERISPEAAAAAWELYDQVLAAEDAVGGS